MWFCLHLFGIKEINSSMAQGMHFSSSFQQNSANHSFNSNLSKEDKSAFYTFKNVREVVVEAPSVHVEEETKRLDFIRGINNDKTTVNKSTLLCCKFFVSEGRNREALEAIEQAASTDTETVVVNKFDDDAYNRTRYTLVSYVVHDGTGTPIYSPLKQTVVAMVEAAYAAINLELQTGSHPRLGVVDDIVFHPLARASLDEAAWLAKAVAADIGSRFQVPVFLYAAAHPSGKALETFRRELGFFKPNFMDNQWAGSAMSGILPEKPNEGPAKVSPTRGVVMVGARPWIGLYNVPLMTTDISTTRRIARMVSARGGGLPTVQSVGLAHGEDSTEVACMLLDPNQVGADMVQKRVEMLAAQEGLDAGKGYFTDFSQETILEKYMNLISANGCQSKRDMWTQVGLIRVKLNKMKNKIECPCYYF